MIRKIMIFLLAASFIMCGSDDSKNPSTVTFNTDPGTGGPTSIEVRNGSPMPELRYWPRREGSGYYFTGYFDADGTKYYNADLTSAKDWDKTSDSILYARWDKLPEVEMALIPAGTFMMGSPESEPGRLADETQRLVTMSSFYMGKYPVTQEQYEAVMGKNPSTFNGSPGREVLPGQVQKRRPVEWVNWYEALVFCNKLSIMEGLIPAYKINDSTNPAEWGPMNDTWDIAIIIAESNGYRLPTEAQWEYACRAGTTTPFNFGIGTEWGTSQITSDQANFDATFALYNGSPRGVVLGVTTQVGMYPANAFGLYDMHGNVWEWCWDWYGPYTEGPQTDPVVDNETGATDNTGGRPYSTRVWRGGTYNQSGIHLRSAKRASRDPSYRAPCFGFRVAR